MPSGPPSITTIDVHVNIRSITAVIYSLPVLVAHPAAVDPVASVDFAGEISVGEVRPIILIETLGAFQTLLSDVQSKYIVVRIIGLTFYLERFKRHGKHLVADAQHAAVGDRRIPHSAVISVNDEVVDFAHAL